MGCFSRPELDFTGFSPNHWLPFFHRLRWENPKLSKCFSLQTREHFLTISHIFEKTLSPTHLGRFISNYVIVNLLFFRGSGSSEKLPLSSRVELYRWRMREAESWILLPFAFMFPSLWQTPNRNKFRKKDSVSLIVSEGAFLSVVLWLYCVMRKNITVGRRGCLSLKDFTTTHSGTYSFLQGS